MSDIEVVGLGALNIDHIYQVEHILDDGETIIEESIASPGGSAANTIYALAKLGLKTGFAGIIGDDAEGKKLLKDFHDIGVDTSRIKSKPKAETGAAICLSDRSGKRSLYVSPGANSLLKMEDLDLDFINQTTMLHVSSFVDDRQFQITLKLMDRLALTTRVSFAPGALYAARGLKALAPVLARTSVLFLNQNEMQQLTGQNVIAGSETCLNCGCEIVVVTLGKGIKWQTVIATSYIRDTSNEYTIEVSNNKTISALDTTGAGDAFAAGFLFGLLKRVELKECGLLGDIVAQFSTTKVGARPGLPTLNQLAQRYRELYHKELPTS